MGLLFGLLILVAVIILLEYYFKRKLLRPIKILFPNLNQKKLKRTFGIFLAYFNIYPVAGLVFLIYTSTTQTQVTFPPPNLLFEIFILFPFWVGVVIIIQCAILFLLLDLLRMVTYPFYRSKKEAARKILAKLQLAIIFLFLIYVPARVAFDYFAVSIRPVKYQKNNLNKTLDGFTITLISDMQADRYTNRSRLERYVSKVNKTNPDLVLIAGDIITSTPNYINLGAEYLAKIKSKYGIYSCVGDHDNWAYRGDNQRSLREIKSALETRGIKMVDNDKQIVLVTGARIGITFVTHTYVETINPNLLDSLTDISSDIDLKIFLTHQPREFLVNEARKKNYDLFLAGHTHGGQLTFFFPFFNLTPTLIETKYIRGDSWIGNMLAVVNRGLGMSLVPIRYNSTPEITIIKIVSK